MFAQIPLQSTTIWGNQPAVNGRQSCLTTSSDTSPLGFPDSCGKCALVMSSSHNGWVAGNLGILLATLDCEGETIINWWLHRQSNLVIFSFNFVISWWRLGDFQVSMVEKNQATPHLNKSKSELSLTNINQTWWLIVPGPPANQWLVWVERKMWSLRICENTFSCGN